MVTQCIRVEVRCGRTLNTQRDVMCCGCGYDPPRLSVPCPLPMAPDGNMSGQPKSRRGIPTTLAISVVEDEVEEEVRGQCVGILSGPSQPRIRIHHPCRAPVGRSGLSMTLHEDRISHGRRAPSAQSRPLLLILGKAAGKVMVSGSGP